MQKVKILLDGFNRFEALGRVDLSSVEPTQGRHGLNAATSSIGIQIKPQHVSSAISFFFFNVDFCTRDNTHAIPSARRMAMCTNCEMTKNLKF